MSFLTEETIDDICAAERELELLYDVEKQVTKFKTIIKSSNIQGLKRYMDRLFGRLDLELQWYGNNNLFSFQNAQNEPVYCYFGAYYDSKNKKNILQYSKTYGKDNFFTLWCMMNGTIWKTNHPEGTKFFNLTGRSRDINPATGDYFKVAELSPDPIVELELITYIEETYLRGA